MLKKNVQYIYIVYVNKNNENQFEGKEGVIEIKNYIPLRDAFLR